MSFRFLLETKKKNKHLVLVLLPYSFGHLPSYQTSIAKLLQVTDRERKQPQISMLYCFITFCELLRLPYKVNLCPHSFLQVSMK